MGLIKGNVEQSNSAVGLFVVRFAFKRTMKSQFIIVPKPFSKSRSNVLFHASVLD